MPSTVAIFAMAEIHGTRRRVATSAHASQLNGAPTANASCVLYLVARSASEPDVVHVTEGWTTREAHAENFGREASQALVARNSGPRVDGAFRPRTRRSPRASSPRSLSSPS